MNEAAVQPDSVEALDFAPPCQTSRCKCGNSADVLVWRTHGSRCPDEIFFCFEHLGAYITDFAAFLARAPKCGRCRGVVAGTLETNMRVMPL